MAEKTLTFAEQANEAQARFDVALNAANEALKNNNRDAYDAAMKDLTEAEKDYSDAAGKALYVATKEEAEKNGASPVREIIKVYDYPVLGHVEKSDGDKDDPKVIAVNAVTTKRKQIDLYKFCKLNEYDTSWRNTISKVNELLCLRTAQNVGYSAKELKSLAKSYALRDAVASIEVGGTPTSTTQMCKLLQTVVDTILMPDETEKLKVNSHDVAYLDALYAKRSTKSRITLTISKDEFLCRVLVDVMYRILTGSQYGVDGFKTKKEG